MNKLRGDGFHLKAAQLMQHLHPKTHVLLAHAVFHIQGFWHIVAARYQSGSKDIMPDIGFAENERDYYRELLRENSPMQSH